MIDKREQAPRLPMMVLFEDDVRELADAHVYLDEQNPVAPRAIDLLLGTQGWRRFAFVDPAKFLESHGDPARRVLALRMDGQAQSLLQSRFGNGVQKGIDRGGGLEAAIDEDDDGLPADPQAAVAPKVGHKQDVGKPRRDAAPLRRGKRAADGDRQRRLRVASKIAANQDLGIAAEADIAGGLAPDLTMVAVRQYAHRVRPNRRPNDRVDFTETLYWNTGISTDAKTGEATVAFGLNE